MPSTLATPPTELTRMKGSGFRHYEKVILAYFVYLPCLGLVRHLRAEKILALLAITAALGSIWRLQSRSDRAYVKVARDWWPLGLILVAYWAMGWFTRPPRIGLQQTLLSLDRLILDRGHLRNIVEVAGPLFPGTLETVYFLLYAIPPICLGILYACGERAQAPRFLLFVFAGTLTVYGLLPYVTVLSPRVEFPNTDLPHYNGFVRHLNTWVLDHWDVPISVLPSGHVAVAFSSALGMVRVLPRRPIIGRCVLAVAGAVYLATVYCRYHYAVDGLVSMVMVSGVCLLAAWTLDSKRTAEKDPAAALRRQAGVE